MMRGADMIQVFVLVGEILKSQNLKLQKGNSLCTCKVRFSKRFTKMLPVIYMGKHY